MLELSRHLRFGDEALPVHRDFGELLVDALESNVAQEVSIGGRMDAPDAAATELGIDHEMRRKRNRFALDLLGGDLMLTSYGNRLDDVDRLQFLFGFCVAHCRKYSGGHGNRLCRGRVEAVR